MKKLAVKEINSMYKISIPSLYVGIHTGKFDYEIQDKVYKILINDKFIAQLECSISEQWVSVTEIRKHYPVSRQAIHHWKSKFPTKKERNKLYFDRSEINRYFARNSYLARV